MKKKYIRGIGNQMSKYAEKNMKIIVNKLDDFLLRRILSRPYNENDKTLSFACLLI